MTHAEAFATHWHGSQVRNIEHCREIEGSSAYRGYDNRCLVT